jgi:beta-aspartyl-peptidase (threonine type)
VDCISLVVHGGAGVARSSVTHERRAGLRRALDRGWAILNAGGSSLDACEQAIVELEDEPVFDAGVGAYLNRDGRPQLDAILMDGATLNAGAVAAVERIRNPIRLARLVLDRSESIFLVGTGAEQFASEHGLQFCDPSDLITPFELERWKTRSGGVPAPFGTVGAVARDAAGNVAAGTSTGGTFFKYPGRVGDSPLIGCGCYADNLSGAVSCTGHGEPIMKVVLGKTAADFVGNGHSPQTAADMAVGLLARRASGVGGLIVVDRHGSTGVSFSTPHMSWAMRSTSGEERIVG